MSKYPTEWNLSPLLKNDDDPKQDQNIKTVEEESYKFINKWQDRDDYLKNPAVLKEALDEYEVLAKKYGTSGDVGYYFALRSALDQENPKIKARINKLEEITLKIANDIQFFTHRIAKIPSSEQKKFLEFAELNNYKHFLEFLFDNAKYLLSEDEEKIMNLKSTTSYANWVSMVQEFVSREEAEVLDENGNKTLKPFSEIAALMNNKNKKIRDTASKKFNVIMEKNVDVAEHELNSVLYDKKVNDNLRKMERPDLGRHIADDIESEVVDTLIKTVVNRFKIAHNFYKLKSGLLGVDKLEYHERNVEYGELNKKYSYDEAIDLIKKTFERLDPEFKKILDDFVQNGQIDAFPKKGKSSGAFLAHNLQTQPQYVLLNHTEKLNDVLTIAHEMGHAIHYTLANKKQNSLNTGASTATTEVASTFMEDFVLQEMAKTADDELKLAIMMQKLNDDVSTIIRQVACYKFEQELHQKFREIGYLPKKEIGKLFSKHMSAYMGDFVEQSEGSENWWVYWTHIRSFFYVYSYAGGLLISKALQSEVKNDANHITKIKEFMGAGTSNSPKEIFADLGIDIANAKFWNSGLDEVEQLLENTEKLAKKLGKI